MKSVAAALILLVLATWAGPLHPAGDTLSVLRVPLLVLAALAMIWTTWPLWLRGTVAGLCLVALGQVVWMKTTAPVPGGFTVYQKNLWFGNLQTDALARDILSQSPDVVTLQEVSRHNDRVLNLLRADYPHQHRCNSYGWSVVVLSRHPVVAGQTLCSSGRGLAGLQVSMPQGPVWVLSLHLFWPWPHEQRPQATKIAAMIDGLKGPVVLAGDFNMMPWGSDVRRLVHAAGVRRAGPLIPTYWLQQEGWPLSVPLPLDQVWATGGGRVHSRPQIGSDHAGLLARVHLDVD
ncbi:endonuclease/exonuclease/phosphatase family protein [Antarctobacter jejuensis]|uniref:endonuclease/exonuclease/phosphatase family protein n=1 Tax=Antarctobacter jejuensis TaxID=1439938 RepID=UPI003FD345B2